MTIRKLDLAFIFAEDAERIAKARLQSARIHGTGDIRAAGNEVEIAVREYLRRMLPPRWYVTSGHLIDQAGKISPQLDVIIADNFNLPSLLTTKDGTEYIPITSALAIGEVKSTYRHSERPYERLQEVLQGIQEEMHRPLIENTAYPEPNINSAIDDLIIIRPNKYLNHLFSFLFCVHSGDFEFSKVEKILTESNVQYLPNMAVLLDSGIITYGYVNNDSQRFEFHKYPMEVMDVRYRWCFVPGEKPGQGSQRGTHLAFWYAQLVSHLAGSKTGQANAYPYIMDVSSIRKSSIRWAGESHIGR